MVTSVGQTIDTGNVILTVIEEGIIENHVKAGCNIDVSDAWILKKNNLQLSENSKYCVLVTAGHLSTVSKEAREVIASNEYVQKTIAKAMLVDSLGQRIVGNFYITVNKPKIRTKLFRVREDAIAWLKDQYAQHKD